MSPTTPPPTAHVRGEPVAGAPIRRFADGVAAIPVIMGFLGITLFAQELSLGASLASFFGTIALLFVLISGLLAGLVLGSLVRMRARGRPIPITLLALVAMSPSLSLRVPLNDGLDIVGPWLSGWYFAGLTVVMCAEVMGPFQATHISNTPTWVDRLHRVTLVGAALLAIAGAAIEDPLLLPLALMSLALGVAGSRSAQPPTASAAITAPWFAALGFVAAFASGRLLGMEFSQTLLGVVVTGFVIASGLAVVRYWPAGRLDAASVAALALSWMVWTLGQPLPPLADTQPPDQAETQPSTQPTGPRLMPPTEPLTPSTPDRKSVPG